MAISAIFLRPRMHVKEWNGVYWCFIGTSARPFWLSTMSPHSDFSNSEAGLRSRHMKMWILNVGDIKPAEYQIELLWIWIREYRSCGLGRSRTSHLKHWFKRNWELLCAKAVLPVQEHYRLPIFVKPPNLWKYRGKRRRSCLSCYQRLPMEWKRNQRTFAGLW